MCVRRIDSPREQLLQSLVDSAAMERALDERVEAEGGQVAFVKDNRMPQIDRLTVVRLFCQQIEQQLRSLTHASVRRGKLLPVCRDDWRHTAARNPGRSSARRSHEPRFAA